jgi:tRNA (guanine-N7-)-methyltransferase
MTRGQQRALDELRDTYCIDPTLNPEAFSTQYALSDAPIGIEIGFGMGQALAHWAELQPDWNLLGIEVYEPGIGSLLLQLEDRAISNVRVVEADARVLLEEFVAPASVAQINIFFPDPWPKKRHARRRIVQADTLALFASRLIPGGSLRIATDWAPYAEWILEYADAQPQLINVAGGYAPRAAERPLTKFEQRGLLLGHEVWDFHYERVPGVSGSFHPLSPGAR